MNLQERLMADLKEAMKSHDTSRREVIRMVRAAIKNAEIEWQREATDQEVQDIIAREVKRRREAIALFRQGGRQDLVDEEEAQVKILESYLPQQMSRPEIEEVIRRIVARLGATGLSQMGPVMRQAMAELKGKADGSLVNQIAREILSE